MTTGITVCVEYSDLLAVTLERNREHFDRVLVVTTYEDTETHRVVQTMPNCEWFTTEAFYRNGAAFNKGLAIEEALEAIRGFGWLRQSGWLCSFDADILMPRRMPLPLLRKNTLYAPWRRILPDPTRWRDYENEATWPSLERYEETWEFAGAFLLFNVNAPHLRGKWPWFGVNWKHAGGYDSDFYYSWPAAKRFRMDFDVLHLGEHGRNWFGRTTPMLDGRLPEHAAERAAMMDSLPARRKREGYAWEKTP